jgi:hypothetical protein
MPGPPGPAFGRPEDKLEPGIHAGYKRLVWLKDALPGSSPANDSREAN